MRSIFASLLIANLIFATAPDWARPGLVVSYDGMVDMGGSQVSAAFTYTVLKRDANDIEMRADVAGKNQPIRIPVKIIHENPNAERGIFWMDKAKLKLVRVGQEGILSYGPAEISGRSWLAADFGNFIFDRETGLLLANDDMMLRSINVDLASYRQEISPENREGGEPVSVRGIGQGGEGACVFPYILLSVFGAFLFVRTYGRAEPH